MIVSLEGVGVTSESGINRHGRSFVSPLLASPKLGEINESDPELGKGK